MYSCSRNFPLGFPGTPFVQMSINCTFILQPTFGFPNALIYRWRATVFFGTTMKNLIPAVSVDATVPVEDMLGEGDLYRLDIQLK